MDEGEQRERALVGHALAQAVSGRELGGEERGDVVAVSGVGTMHPHRSVGATGEDPDAPLGGDGRRLRGVGEPLPPQAGVK